MNLLLGTGAIAAIVVVAVLVVLLLAFAIWWISARNSFVSMENQYEERRYSRRKNRGERTAYADYAQFQYGYGEISRTESEHELPRFTEPA